MRHTVFAAALLALPGLAALAPGAAAQTAYVGQIQSFAFNYCPAGWLPADGRTLAIQPYPVLFDVIGTTYGGDGVTTFKVPHMRLQTTTTGVHLTQCIAYLGVFPSQD